MPALFIGFGNRPKALGGVGKIEDAQRIRPLQINEPMPPIGSIHHGTDLRRVVTPRRLVSTSASSAKVAASVKREK